MKKSNIPIYYKRPSDIIKEAEEKQILEIQKREMLLNMSDAERDIYYREQELELQKKMLKAQALSLQQQNEQLKM